MSSELVTAWMLGCVCGFFTGVTVATSQRRPTCRELMRDPAPRQPTFAELLMPPARDRDPDLRRSFSHENTAPNSSEERPLRFCRSTDGYQPRPQQGTPNPPPSEP
jgi:hypothetical protein